MYGNIIRRFRELRGFTQCQLGELVNVSGKTVSSWEVDRTEPNMGDIERLSVALGVPKSVLVGEELTTDKMSAKEFEILTAYRNASKDIRSAVEAVLNVRGD